MASLRRLDPVPPRARHLVKVPLEGIGVVAHEGTRALYQKDIDWTQADLNHRRNQLI